MKQICTLLVFVGLTTLVYAQNTLTRPLIVPEFCYGLVKFYQTNNPTTLLASHTLEVDRRCLPNNRCKPNGVALKGNDLYVNLNTGVSGIYKYANYLDPLVGNQAVFSLVTKVAIDYDYVGIAFNDDGDLYTTEGAIGNNQLFKYTDGDGAKRSVLGNAGITSYLSNIAFDAAGNIWVSDYLNNRIVVYNANGDYRVLGNYMGSIAVGNLNSGLQTASTKVLSKPKGMAFDNDYNLWVGNNNDDGANTYGTLVKISVAVQNLVLATNPSGTYTLTGNGVNGPNQANGYVIYNLPNPSGGTVNCYPVRGVARAHPSGMVIDKSSGQIYVTEQQGNNVLKFNIATIASIVNSYVYSINIFTTNIGNGGICFGDNPPKPKTFTWTGAANDNNWITAGNWTVNGQVAATYPNSVNNIIANVVFPTFYFNPINVPNGLILNTLRVQNGADNTFNPITFVGTVNDVVMTLKREDGTAPGLTIENRGSLSLSSSADTKGFTLQNDASVVENIIYGSLHLDGAANSLPVIYKNATASATTLTRVTQVTPTPNTGGGIYSLGPNTSVINTSPTTLRFENNGRYEHHRDGGNIPNANFATTSWISIRGVTNNLPVFNANSIYGGGLGWDCLNQITTADLNLPKGLGSGIRGGLFLDHGYLSLIGTGTTDEFASFFSVAFTAATLKINTADFRIKGNVETYGNGDIIVNGATSSLCVGGAYQTSRYSKLSGTGKLKTVGGVTVFADYLSLGIDPTIANFVRVPILQCQALCVCNGAFRGTNTNLRTAAADPVKIEVTGNDNNNTDLDLPTDIVYNLKVNSPGGVTLVAPMKLANLELVTGVLRTVTTVTPPANVSTTLTLEETTTLTGGSSTSYIQGLAAKKTNSTTPFTFPLGAGSTAASPVASSTYNPVTITPQNSNPTTYMAQFFNFSPPNNAVLTAPLTGLFDSYFDISRPSGTTNAKITLTPQSGMAGQQTVIAHYKNSSWQLEGGNPIVTTGGTGGSSTVTTSNFVSSFSPFALATMPVGVLPVELLGFKATPSVARIILDWQTVSEVNSNLFVIERSTDGQVFEHIGDVKAQGKAATYTFEDKMLPSTHLLYYRLKIQDTNGKFDHSKTLSVSQKVQTDPLSIFPNPVHQTMTIQFETTQNAPIQTHDFIVTDLLGKIVFSKKIENKTGLNTLSVNVSHIAAGIYFARLEDAFVRFVIQ